MRRSSHAPCFELRPALCMSVGAIGNAPILHGPGSDVTPRLKDIGVGVGYEDSFTIQPSKILTEIHTISWSHADFSRFRLIPTDDFLILANHRRCSYTRFKTLTQRTVNRGLKSILSRFLRQRLRDGKRLECSRRWRWK